MDGHPECRREAADHSDGRKGNVGYPVEPHEIERFVKMLRGTARHMDDAKITALETALKEYAANRETR